MKIAIYGTGVVSRIIQDIADKHDVQVLFYVQTKPDCEFFNDKYVISPEKLRYDDVDYVILGSDVYKQEMQEALQKDSDAYTKNCSKIIDFEMFVDVVEPDIDFKTVKVDHGISYIYSKYDAEIGPCMERTHRNWAGDAIDNLMRFSQENLGLRTKGFFLDIGANIGTTSVYVKKLWHDFQLIAFEPGKKNYDLLRANCILNGVDDCRIENIGLGDKPSEGFLFYRSYNPGGSMVVDKKTEISQEQVTIGTLDDYLTTNGLKAEEISFIWMDTEGFEADIIIGSVETLGRKAIPLVHEFDPQIYEDRGKITEYLNIMRSTYSHFIDVSTMLSDDYKITPISELSKMIDEKEKTDLFFFRK